MKRRRSTDPDSASLRRVGWRLAALTIGLIAALLLALGITVYATTDGFLMQSLQKTVLQRTAAARPFLARDGRVPSFIGDVSFVIADQQLTVIRAPDPYSPTAVPDAAAAKQVLNGRVHPVWSTQQVNNAGPYLIYTLPVQLVQPDGSSEPGVLEASVSEQQYLHGLRTLLEVLLGVSGAGLLAATAISVVLARRALQPIQTALRRQRDFVADAAHELRTPLTIQRTAMELGLAAGAIAEQQGAIEQALTQNVHLTHLVDNLSLLARADSGAVFLELQPVDLARVTQETASGVEILAEEHGVRLQVEISEGIHVLGDIGRLRQVLLILLDNALKYTPEGGTIIVRLLRQNGQACLQVRDTGPGIAPDDLPHLFDRFYRADRARSSAGTGLGLAIGRWIAEAHGGHISVANAPEGGALFTVMLPVATLHMPPPI